MRTGGGGDEEEEEAELPNIPVKSASNDVTLRKKGKTNKRTVERIKKTKIE